MQPETDSERMEFHYIKSANFRVIHVDGVHGGVSPRQKIQMAIFSERSPIPQRTSHRVVKEGHGFKLLEEIPDSRVSRSGVIREVEAELLMDLETAEALRTWLEERIQLAKTLREPHA